MDAAVAAPLSELDGVFTFDGEQRTALKDFLGGQHGFASLWTGFGKSKLLKTNLMGPFKCDRQRVLFFLLFCGLFTR